MNFKARKHVLSVLAAALAVTACSSNNNHHDNDEVAPPVTEGPVPAFDADGSLDANIRWTTYGVPHIKADNLESLAFGVGYAFANDGLCILADQIVKFNSERSKYFGPDRVAGSGDAENLINDFGYLTVGIREIAENQYQNLSDNTRAMMEGYAAGYNKYLEDTPVGELDPQCGGQPWVQAITGIDVYNFSLGIALLPGAANFLGPMFIAAPPGISPNPTPVNTVTATDQRDLPQIANLTKLPSITMPDRNPAELGSNGWGLGSELTENGMGMVLANPHFPHTGNLRFWQFHSTIPGYLDVIGGSLAGVPGVVNIGFNDHMAWTHTFSTAEHFVVYQLELDASDPSSMTHLIDGEPQEITEKTMTIEVAVGADQTMQFEKTAYYTNYGPMIAVPGSFEWGTSNAFAIKDANLPNNDIVDHWLALNLSSDMDSFKQAFKDYDGVIFNNTMAASKEGEVFYIDDSTVPNLSSTAISALTNDPTLVQTRLAAGFTVLPGSSSAFDFDGPVPYDEAPKYEGNDSVQNSNDSFWLTNLQAPITGVSPLYGPVDNQQSLRSRHGQQLIASGAGGDSLFSPSDVTDGLLRNDSYLAQEILPELLATCAAQGTVPVVVDGESINIGAACAALDTWDGTMNTASTGAHVFREFAFQFANNPQWETAFDVTLPVSTPRGLLRNQVTLQQFATAVHNLRLAGIDPDAEFGTVQFVERNYPDGTATGVKLPWGGAHNIEGGFNVFAVRTGNDGTLLPRLTYPTLEGTSLSADGQGYHISYGSSWMFVMNFTEDGPVGNGILTYSQSRVQSDENSTDQTLLYSGQPQLRPMLFTDEDITADTVQELNLSQTTQ